MIIRLICFVSLVVFLILSLRRNELDSIALAIAIFSAIAFEILSFINDWILGLIVIISFASVIYFVWYIEKHDRITAGISCGLISSLLMFSISFFLQIVEIFVKIF